MPSTLPILLNRRLAAEEPTTLPAELPGIVIPGLYLHIPFCFHKCHYCDFYSITRQTPQRMGEFVDLILAEAAHWTTGAGPRLRPRTVFFGGGTPTLLPFEQMRLLIAGLKARFDFSDCDEFTVEANPATVTDEYCRTLAESGVNRLSFGAQSFDRAELAILERHHDPDDIPRSLELARAAGFSRLNLDLIYGICGQSNASDGQTLASWSRSLETALALGTEHLSCYGLTYEPNTPLAVRKRLGRVLAMDEQEELTLAAYARRRSAQAGLAAYEISNFARPGAQCRHNLLYWTGGDYIGLGPSAASHVQGRRWKNRPHLGEWERAVRGGKLPMIDVERLSIRRRAGELAMLSLRLTRGIVYGDFAERFDLDGRRLFADPVDRLSRLGFLHADERGARMTERGWAVADSLAEEFLLSDEM